MKLLTLSFALLVLVPGADAAATRQVVEAIAVRVNDRILTVSEVRQRIEEQLPGAMANLTRERAEALLSEVADELCLLERAQELRIDLTSEEISHAVRQLREENQILDDAEFEAMLQASGMTMERLRQRIRESMLINYVMSREVGTLPITEEELRQRYERDRERFRVPEQVHLHHLILDLNVDRTDLDRRMADARRLIAASQAGEGFLDLVEFEIQRGGASGGDLGVIELTDLRSEIAAAIETLDDGSISEPFTSPAGVHVVKVVERIPASYQPFKEVVEEVRSLELGERYQQRMEGVVDRLKKRYVVEVFPELLL